MLIVALCASCRGSAELHPPLPPSEGCTDAPTFSPTQLLDGAGSNEMVAVEGVPVATISCEYMSCCRNSCECRGWCRWCEGEYHVERDGHGVTLSGLEGCDGSGREFECQPFGRRPKTAYRFVGRHEFTPPSEGQPARSTLHLQQICPPTNSLSSSIRGSHR